MPIEPFSINFESNPGCHGFARLCSVIGPENSRHLFDQSGAELKPIATWSLAFFPHLISFHVFTLSSHWLLLISCITPIGRLDNFGLRFTTLNWIRAKSTGPYYTCSWWVFSVGSFFEMILFRDTVSMEMIFLLGQSRCRAPDCRAEGREFKL